MNVSVVVPLFNEAESLPELTSWIQRVCTQHHLGYEIWLVDDGSTDDSWEVILQLKQQNTAIKGINFREIMAKVLH